MTVPVRDAATVMLLRDGDEGVEVFMLRRHLQAVFTPGAYVFPGGAIDDADRAVPGVDPFVVAAVRECFEESGALLAFDATGRFADLRDEEVAARFEVHRRAIHTGDMTLVELCETEDLRPAYDALVPFAQWLTPPGAPRRFDTRFFVARAPEDQAFLHDDTETIESLWIRPADALDRFGASELDLIRPTRESLEQLAAATTVDDFLVSVA